MAIVLGMAGVVGLPEFLDHPTKPAVSVYTINGLFIVAFLTVMGMLYFNKFQGRFFKVYYFSASTVLAGSFIAMLELYLIPLLGAAGMYALPIVDAVYVIGLGSSVYLLNARPKTKPPSALSADFRRALAILTRS